MQKPILWRDGVVRAMRDLTHDIRLFEIAPNDIFVPPTPGGHIKVMVMIGGHPDTRSYSIVGACSDGIYRIAVKLLPDTRGGSAYMWGLKPGARLSLAGPDNHFNLSVDRPDYLLLAGGIGITPIFTHALALHEKNANFSVLYAARGRADLALAGELRAAIGDRLAVYVAEEGTRVDLASEIARLSRDGELYVCGPIGMLEAVKRAWSESGRPFDRLRFETFGNSGRYATEAFVVHIPRLQKSFTVRQNQTFLEALEEQGVAMIYDCRRGECGLCALDIKAVDGVIDHRDVYFSEEQKAEGRKLCTCVSRVVKGSITVDTADRA